MKEYIIRNVSLYNAPGSSMDLWIRDGRFCAVGQGLSSETAEVIEGRGLVAAPGFLDIHVHFRDPGFTYKEDIASGAKAAAAGGFTTVAVMPNTRPVGDSPETIRYILEQAAKTGITVLPVGSITQGQQGKELCDLEALQAAGAVAFSDDGVPVRTAALMRQALLRAKALHAPVLAHCEEPTLAEGGIVHEGAVAAQLGVRGIPGSAEDIGTAREILLAMETGCPVHICHVSTARSVAMIRHAKSIGVPVTAETAPHYFVFTEEVLLTRDADYRMNPPLRTERDREAVIEGLLDGTLDVIATDHAPHAKAEKADFLTAPNGVVGLETALAAGITFLVRTGRLTLPQLIAKITDAPARVLGLPTPALAEGNRADLVLFDPEASYRVEPGQLHSKSTNTPFKGMTLFGRVQYTFAGGNLLYEQTP